MTWLFYSIAALILFSLYDLFSRYFGVQTKNPRAFSVVYNILVCCMVPLIIVIEPVRMPFTGPSIVAVTVLVIILWGLFGRLEYFYS